MTYVVVGALALVLSQLDGGPARDRILSALVALPTALIVCWAVLN